MPKRTITPRYTFDCIRFHAALKRAARELGSSLTEAARDVGISHSCISNLRAPSRLHPPGTTSLLALCAWAGLNPMDYLEDTQDSTSAPRGSI
jgi:hypothetical protein